MSGTDRSRSTAAQENQSREGVIALLAQAESRKANFLQLLPSEIPWEAFKDTFKLAVQTNPRLLDANRESLWIALQRAALDGLRPDGRDGALVIFGDDSEDEDGNVVKSTAGKPKRVQWMPMVRGLIKQVRNTGEVTNVRANLIYEGETFHSIDEDGQISYRHERRMDRAFDDGFDKIVGAYAVIQFKDGSWDMEPMSRAQIDRVRAVSRAKKGPWVPWYDEMAKKTVLRRLLKRQQMETSNRALAALDRDEGLTIDGEAEVEVAAANALPSPGPARRADPPADDPPRDPPKTVDPPKQDAPKADAPKQDAPKPDPKPAARRPDPKPEPAKEAPPPAAEEFSYCLLDQYGDPVGDYIESAAVWVAEFEAAMAKTAVPETLLEQNADAMGDAIRDAALAQRIQAALAAARERLTPPKAALEPEAPAADDAPSPLFVAVPTTQRGGPHWPNYIATIIAALETEEDLSAWHDANRVSFDDVPATKSKVIGLLDERLAAIRAAGPSDPVDPDQTAPDAADPAPWAAFFKVPADDKDAAWAWQAAQDLAAAADLTTLRTLAGGAAVRAKMQRFKAERPELFAFVNRAGDERLAALQGPPG